MEPASPWYDRVELSPAEEEKLVQLHEAVQEAAAVRVILAAMSAPVQEIHGSANRASFWAGTPFALGAAALGNSCLACSCSLINN